MLPGLYISVSKKCNATRIAKMFCGTYLVNLIITFEDLNLFINIIIFRHLEQVIALAIPTSNE